MRLFVSSIQYNPILRMKRTYNCNTQSVWFLDMAKCEGARLSNINKIHFHSQYLWAATAVHHTTIDMKRPSKTQIFQYRIILFQLSCYGPLSWANIKFCHIYIYVFRSAFISVDKCHFYLKKSTPFNTFTLIAVWCCLICIFTVAKHFVSAHPVSLSLSHST